MWRKSIVLLIALIMVTVAVVNVRYETRSINAQLEKARETEQQLQAEWNTYQVQQVSATKNDRIAELVTRQGMQRVDPTVTYYMTPNGSGNADFSGAVSGARRVP